MTDQDAAGHRSAAERGGGSGEETTGTVLLAGAANLAIAIAKLVGGVITGSSAMFAEAAHSVADTMNQVFLLTAVKRSERPADAQHQFGYGKERYFWSLLAAVGIFVAGGIFSILEGIFGFLNPEEGEGYLVAYAVLAIAFLAEGASWLKAVRQVKGEAEQRHVAVREHLTSSPDPAPRTVAFEDTAALIGIVLAAAGLALHQVTGQAWWDGLASVLIGLLLIGVAFQLGRSTKALLIGQSVSAPLQRGIEQHIAGDDAIVDVLELMTMYLGPQEVLVAARVDLADGNGLDAGDVEAVADRVDSSLRERFPEVRHVFIDPTPGRAPESGAAGSGVNGGRTAGVAGSARSAGRR